MERDNSNTTAEAIKAAPQLLAYEVNIDDMRCIVFAATPAKARWKAVKAYWEAGYGRRGVWPCANAARRPHFDDHPAQLTDPDRAYCESYL